MFHITANEQLGSKGKDILSSQLTRGKAITLNLLIIDCPHGRPAWAGYIYKKAGSCFVSFRRDQR